MVETSQRWHFERLFFLEGSAAWLKDAVFIELIYLQK